MIFYLTFGQKSPAKNGWIEVHAIDYTDALSKVKSYYGCNWSMLYGKDNFNPGYFSTGKLGELK